MKARGLVAAALIAASGLACGAEPPPNKALAAFFEREWKNEIEEFPETGTMLGLEGYDHRVADYSPAAVKRRRDRVAKTIAALERFDPKALSTQDRISRDVLLDALRLVREEQRMYGDLPFEAATSWMPISTMHGPQSAQSQLTKGTPFRRTRDYENYLKRLEAQPRVLQQQVDAMRAGLRSGWVPPQPAMHRVPAMLDDFAGSDVTRTPLWEPFTKFPAAVTAADQERLAAEGRVALAKVHAAYAAYQKFLRDEYLPKLRTTLGAASLPGGEPFYALKVKEQTTTTLTPAEIHETGLAEVARIRAEMDKAIADAKFQGTRAEFIKFINSEPRFFFTKPEDRLRAYRDIAKRADAELPKLFFELPRTPYGVRAMDPYEGDNADHYSQGALDGSRAGFFDANVNNLQNRPSHEMEAVLLHEAVPGHHLQVARALELKGLPEFRRAGWYVAYGEGWALYAESLGYEMGFYTDPYMRFGALSAEMLRACRLVIDTGLHSRGWTREQSIAYLVDNAAYNEASATAEVDRYIVWAGQALGYKIGQLKIKALRAKAKEALGDKFDVRRFHNAILDDGAVPLTVLESRIDEWIAAQKAKQ